MKRGWLIVAALALIPCASLCMCGEKVEVGVATFNLENYPRHEGQGRAAFEVISGLEVSAVAMQEIVNPERFAREARRHLGASWRFVWSREGGPQRVGVLYDSDALELRGSRSHVETLLYPRARPALEVALMARASGAPVTLLVVHLKAGGEGAAATRRRQLDALSPVLDGLRERGAPVVLLGDMNSTTDADRAALASLARQRGLEWATEPLACTHYWSKKASCPAHPLDHALTGAPARDVRAAGACATVGCDPGDACPVYRREVSDHCPVRMSLELD